MRSLSRLTKLELGREGPQPVPPDLWFGILLLLRGQNWWAVHKLGQVWPTDMSWLAGTHSCAFFCFVFKTLSGAHALQSSADSTNLYHQVTHMAHYLSGL